MRACLRALASGYLPVMSELLHVLKPSCERGPQSQGNSATRYYAECPKH